MKEYLIHPPTRGVTPGLRPGLIIVSRRSVVRGKEELHRAFSIDMPGSWYDNAWNLHVDGCDHMFTNLDDCLYHGGHILDWDGSGSPGFVMTRTDRPFEQHGLVFE